MSKNNLNYDGIFEKWEIETAKYWAKIFMEEREDNEEDLFQKCLIKWIEVRDTYSEIKGASRRTYMSRVLNNLLINLLKKNETEKRVGYTTSCSLDSVLSNNASMTLHDILEKPDTKLQKRILRLDYIRVFQKLSPEYRTICEQIIKHGLDVDKISKSIKKHPASVYRYIEHIRQIFEKEGLKEYL